MDRSKRPVGRQKKVVSGGKGVEREGEGLGTGKVGNVDHSQHLGGNSRPQQTRPQQAQSQQTRPQQTRPQQTRPQQSGFFGQAQNTQQNTYGQTRPAQQNPFGQSRPAQQNSFSQSRPAQQSPFGQTRPQQNTQQSVPFAAGAQQQATQQAQHTPQPARPASTVQRASGTKANSGCSSKLFLIVIAAVVLLGGGKLAGLFGGGSDTSDVSDVISQVVSSSGQTGNSVSSSLSSSSSGTDMLSGLLSMFGSNSGSVYDLPGLFGGQSSTLSSGDLSSLLGGMTASSVSSAPAVSSSSSAGGKVDRTVAKGSRAKYTKIKGNGNDTITIMVYMCGADLESQSGMATSDLKEMCAATLSDRINLIVYTGGCRSWRNSAVSSSVNQIWQISGGKIRCLEQNMGNVAMTTPSTLSKFIQYGKKNFPADRYDLIFWDHGGGSISGFGHDEKFTSSGSMTLAGINTALTDGGVKFDFIGFDACLMATLENGLMLSKHADYLIGSEETEPGVGWFYTNWLTALSDNTSMKTIDLGKIIADDFVTVCAQQCRGQGTTLSVTDLAELTNTVPSGLKAFAQKLTESMKDNNYAAISTARNNAREFAQSSRIDMVDVVDFATRVQTDEADALAEAVRGAVKYNRTASNMTNAYGLSVYFPYKKVSNVSAAVSTYNAIGMDADYVSAIREFAGLETSGQIAAGGSGSSGYSMNSLFGSLTGSGYSAPSYGSSSASGISDLLSLFMGGGSSATVGGYGSSALDFLSGRSMTVEETANYIAANQFDESGLVWTEQNGQNVLLLPEDQWNLVESALINVFVDDGKGYIDLGTDTTVDFTEKGDLIGAYDNTWLSIDKQPIAYYYLDSWEEGDAYSITGYTPVLLNGEQAQLIIVFDSDNPDGYIAGARRVYPGGETDTVPKTMIGIGKGDKVSFLCDYYSYSGEYKDSYRLGEEITLGNTVEIANTDLGADSKVLVTWCLTDIYQQQHWTPAL
ncbi:MAG: clostripain-related cysteine peptidase [Clostridia bacterium]|nr:clostripain-related cysteine peptidase [Clostridia bacterium]